MPSSKSSKSPARANSGTSVSPAIHFNNDENIILTTNMSPEKSKSPSRPRRGSPNKSPSPPSISTKRRSRSPSPASISLGNTAKNATNSSTSLSVSVGVLDRSNNHHHRGASSTSKTISLSEQISRGRDESSQSKSRKSPENENNNNNTTRNNTTTSSRRSSKSPARSPPRKSSTVTEVSDMNEAEESSSPSPSFPPNSAISEGNNAAASGKRARSPQPVAPSSKGVPPKSKARRVNEVSGLASKGVAAVPVKKSPPSSTTSIKSKAKGKAPVSVSVSVSAPTISSQRRMVKAPPLPRVAKGSAAISTSKSVSGRTSADPSASLAASLAKFPLLNGYLQAPRVPPPTEEEIWSDATPFERKTKDADFDAESMYKFITWNVAGLRGLLKKDAKALATFLNKENPDFLCLQETKLNDRDKVDNAKLGVVKGYTFVDHVCIAKNGYSGTRTYIRDVHTNTRTTLGFTLQHQEDKEGTKKTFALGGEKNDMEGRVLTTLFHESGSNAATSSTSSTSSSPHHGLALINTYIPNSGMQLDRLPYRVNTFDVSMRSYVSFLDKRSQNNNNNSTHSSRSGSSNGPSTNSKGSASLMGTGGTGGTGGVIWTGDLNVAERDYDRYFQGNFISMEKVCGFTPQEKASFRKTLQESNVVDAFRHVYPNQSPAYTFWSARIGGRAKGAGWRLDYFVLSAALASRVVDCFPLQSVMGSDHCPLALWLKK